LINQRLKFLKP